MDENASVIVSIHAEHDAPEAVQFYRWLGICVLTWAFVDRLLYQIFHHASGAAASWSLFSEQLQGSLPPGS